MFVSGLYAIVVKLCCGKVSQKWENVICGYEELKNIVIKGRVKVYSMHIIKQ